MKRHKNIILFILLIFLITLLSGCKYDKIENKEDKNVQTNVFDKNSTNILERSENISDLIVDLIGIENATTIIFGDLAMVSVKLYDENNIGLTEDLRNSIEKIVLENDEQIKKVLITDNDRIFNGIEEIIQRLMEGESIKDQTNKLNKILRKMNGD